MKITTEHSASGRGRTRHELLNVLVDGKTALIIDYWPNLDADPAISVSPRGGLPAVFQAGSADTVHAEDDATIVVGYDDDETAYGISTSEPPGSQFYLKGA